MARCKHVEGIERCFNSVRTIPDKSKPSCNWHRFHPDVSEVCLYTSKKCPSGLCEYHWKKEYYKKLKKTL